MNAWRTSLLQICIALIASATAAEAQEVPVVSTRAPTDAPALERTISLKLDRVPLARAIDTVAQRAGVRIVYSDAWLPAGKTVSLTFESISVRDALHLLIGDAGLSVSVSRRGWVMLEPMGTGPAADTGPADRQGTATITGRVTDAALKTPLSDVAVRIEGTTRGTTAGADGKYTIAGVAAGSYRVTARRVGYQSLSKDVTVAADQQATLGFALVAAPTRLDEIVTTAVGQQRRYEVGNDISTINADSIAPTAPITSLTDLISARAPGVTVLETSGMTGSGEAIRIEGLTSLVLQNDPILIVDGVRQDNAAGGDVNSYFNNNLGNVVFQSHPSPTRLNDIDFSQIEAIDILKGPAAATEYGTDAANGVIVIATKRGTAGTPRWLASAEYGGSQIPQEFANGYYSWGHLTTGAVQSAACPVVPLYGGLYASSGPPYSTATTFGTCVVDSVTQWNPLNHAATSIFGLGQREKYGLSVSGGSDAIRYYAAGGLSNEVGMIRMPPVFRRFADTAGLGLPSSASNPNSEQQRSVRINTAITLSPKADLTATGSYLSTYQQTPDAGLLYDAVITGSPVGDAAHYYGYGEFNNGSAAYTPISELTALGSQQSDRLVGGLTANWRPAGWFAGHATVGLDHGSQRSEELDYPLANPNYMYYRANLGLVNATTDVYSADLRGTATASLTRAVRLVTSGGVQMVDNRTAGQSGLTQNITATNLTLNGATSPLVAQQATRQATLGGYGEEQMSIADRLFVTGALRVDAGSGFGMHYATAAYPKASLSWLVISQSATTVRLRGAFGESGVQPANGAAIQLYTPTIAYLGGALVTVSSLNWPGNPNLQPERSQEIEGGADLSAWNNRVSLAATAYLKTTHDALVNLSLGEDLGYYTYQENIGDVRNTGAEASLTVGVLQTRSTTWDIAINASVNRNRLLLLAPGVPAQLVYVGNAEFRQAPGYPLYGIWATRITYADANHDGIIEPGEVHVADSASFAGSSLPTQEASISTHVGLWRGAVAIGALVDYRGGYRIVNSVALEGDQSANRAAENSPTSPLWQQARSIPDANFPVASPYVEDGAFVRVREVSLTYALPQRAVRAMRAASVGITAAVRNLALWTRYSGPDPEVTNSLGFNVQSVPSSNTNLVNNDTREGGGAVPLARYWILRLNVTL